MILTHIRSYVGSSFSELHSKIDLQKNNFVIIQNSVKVEINLPVKLIRNSYGNGELGVIIGIDYKNEINVFVYKIPLDDKYVIQKYRESNKFPKDVFFAHLPANTILWTDPGVSILTREITKQLDKPYNYVQIFYTESEDTEPTSSWINKFIFAENVWSTGFIFPEGFTTDVKKIG